MRRIGTTTVALQAVKYLTFIGKKACCIERNDTRFVQTLKQFVNFDREDDSLSMVTYKHTDIFWDPARITDILALDYDVFVYDYGSMDNNIDLISILEKDIIIAVCGAKGDEMTRSTDLLDKLLGSPAYFLFNFVPGTERPEIMKLMGREKCKRTLFMGYSPDPVTYSADNAPAFASVFGSADGKPKKKRRWK
jgi:hypothetical protein